MHAPAVRFGQKLGKDYLRVEDFEGQYGGIALPPLKEQPNAFDSCSLLDEASLVPSRGRAEERRNAAHSARAGSKQVYKILFPPPASWYYL